MADSLNESVFTKLMNPKFVQKEIVSMPKLKNLSLANYFTLYTAKDRQSCVKVYCELWENIILMRESPKKNPVGFMEVSYARLKISKEPGDKKLRFIKNKKYEEMWNDDDEVLEAWHRKLAKVCVYSNFRSDFDIHTLLGKGNFAKVYLVEDRRSLEKVAAKIFDKGLIKNDEFEKVGPSNQKCFLYEIDMLREVDYRHLLRTHKIYEGENNIYCVGDYYSGGSLYTYLSSAGKPTETHAVKIIFQLLEALSYLEKRGLIHRDLKPENIMFEDKSLESVSLVDFGFMTRASEFNLLFTRCGTPGYVAPEVLADQAYNCKADLYSLGIIFYILITKCNPFNHKSYSKLIQRNKAGVVDMELVTKQELQQPDHVRDALSKMLSRDASLRPKASDLIHHKLFAQLKRDSDSQSENLESTLASPLNQPLKPKSLKSLF